VEIYTIGFTQKNAARFFGLLRQAGIGRLVDVRLNNVSQLAGFTRRDDLAFFLKELCGAAYLHEPLLAPTKELLAAYRTSKDWATYEREFTALIATRRIETLFPPDFFATPTVLLCSEPTPANCHRRLLAEYLQARLSHVTVAHL
jgi:uncharacterized protein (DUF488 family)